MVLIHAEVIFQTNSGMNSRDRLINIQCQLTEAALFIPSKSSGEASCIPRKSIYVVLEEVYVDLLTPFFTNSQSGKTLDTLVC
jgi:hypothetical protein